MFNESSTSPPIPEQHGGSTGLALRSDVDVKFGAIACFDSRAIITAVRWTVLGAWRLGDS